MRPVEVVVLREGKEVRMQVEDLKKGDLVLVKPDENIPADGIVIRGFSSANQASITWESIPVDKSPNDEVFAGTINGQCALQIKVTKPTEDTILSKIIRLVQDAKNEVPPSQLFVECFEGIYAKIVVVIAVLLMILPPYLFKWTWDETIYRTMIFLVVASPCALVSFIMPTMLSAISNGARKGILFKGGIHLENIGGIKAVAFDKTGTLTEGKPKVTDIIAFNTCSEVELLRITASLETLSEHPIARSAVQAAIDEELKLEQAFNIQSVPDMGIHEKLNEQEYRIGKIDLLKNVSLTDNQKSKSIELEKL